MEGYSCHSPDGGDLAIAVSKMVTRMVRHATKMSDNLTAQCIGTRLGHYCWKRLQNMEHEMSQKSIGFFLIHEGCSKARIEYCEDSTKSIANFRAIQGHSGGIPIDPDVMGYVRISDDCKKYFDHRGCSVSIQSILEAWQRRDKKKENPWIKEYSRAWIHKKWTLWCRLQDKHLETVCGKAFRTSSHCPRLFNSQGYASWHRSGAGYRLVWNTRPNLTRMTVLEIPSHYAENAQFFRANPQSRFFLQQFLEKPLLDQSLKFTS